MIAPEWTAAHTALWNAHLEALEDLQGGTPMPAPAPPNDEDDENGFD